MAMNEYADEEERWEDLRTAGLEAAAPDYFEPDEGEVRGFVEAGYGV